MGYKDREFSKKAGFTAYNIMYRLSDELLKYGYSFILESNFKPQFDNEVFARIKETYNPEFIQILCWANGEVLFNRFKARAESGQRHPGHVDTDNFDEFKEILLKGRCEPLNLGGKLIEVDTTDFLKVDFDKIIKLIGV